MNIRDFENRIGGFFEVVDILNKPRTQVHNRLVRERRRTEIWIPGQLPRPFMRIHATPLFDMEEYEEFIRSAAWTEHVRWKGYRDTKAETIGWQEQ
jgi:hypothetical protein